MGGKKVEGKKRVVSLAGENFNVLTGRDYFFRRLLAGEDFNVLAGRDYFFRRLLAGEDFNVQSNSGSLIQ